MVEHYVIESYRYGYKQMEVVDSEDRAIKMTESPHMTYRHVDEPEARKIAQVTQWGLLPSDVTARFVV